MENRIPVRETKRTFQNNNFDFKFAEHDIIKLKMPKTAKQRHVKKKTRPRIKRSNKYQLLYQQANNCVLKKNHYISHAKCERFLPHMTIMMQSFDSKVMHAQD